MAPGNTTSPPEPKAGSALGHVRICDLSGQLAGAGATRFLAAFGAQVIRVEDPTNQGRWDIIRGSMPYTDERRGIELGGGFNNHNVEKLGVTINLRDERGRDLLRRLISVSDVLTENFAAGVLARRGFSWDEMRAVKPDLIYVSNSGFGHTGPYAAYKTFGPIVQACSGLTHVSGLAGQPPTGWGYSYMDHMGGYFMAMAALAGLIHRNRTGEGQWVDMSCTEAGLALTGPDLLDATVNGRSLRRPGYPDSNHSTNPAMAPHAVYPSAGDDDWVAIACRDDHDWQALAGVVAEPWTADDRWSTLTGRMDGQAELDALLGAWTAARTKHEVAEQLLGAGVPAAIVAKPVDRIEHDPATQEWGLWPTVEHPVIGPMKVEGVPVHMSDTDWSIERGAPLLGEHNRAVFGGILGMGDDELDALAADGVM